MNVVINGDTITWDGDTTGATIADGIFVWISEVTPTHEDTLAGYSITDATGETTNITTEEAEQQHEIGENFLAANGFFVAYQDNVNTDFGLTFPKKGLYLLYVPSMPEQQCLSLTIPGYNFNPVKLIDAFIVRRGGSGKLFAAIGVTYPAGSTLTCTNGTKTLTAKTTSGEWVFAIPEAGTWTVTAGSKSKSVNITKEGQFEKVNFAEFVLFDNGKGAENWVGSSNNSSWAKYKIGTTLYVATHPVGQNLAAKITLAEAANLANYNTLNINISGYQVHSNYPEYVDFYIYIGTTQYGDEVASRSVSGTGTISFDVSALTGTYYITLVATGNQNLSGYPTYSMRASEVIAI